MKDFISEFTFGSKAETLIRLEGNLSFSEIPSFFHFSLEEWTSNKERILKRISEMKEQEQDSVIIRSSAADEDGELFANAGAFLSIPHIDPNNKEIVQSSISKVFNSYKDNKNKITANKNDQIMVQNNYSRNGQKF